MQFSLDKEHKNGHSFIVGGGRIIAAIAIIALLITASSCRQVQIVMPPDADTTPETFVAADLDSLVNAVRQAGDGDTIDIRNVSINPEWNQLPLRIRNDVKVTGNIEVSMLASTRSIEEAEASSRALDGKAYLFRVDGNADVVFDSFTVVIEEAAKDFINAVISIDRGSASFSGISITPDVVAVEDSTVIFLDAKKIMTVCSSACRFHSIVVQNLFFAISEKNRKLVMKLGHISKRTTREKLISYLSAESRRQNSSDFTIPFNRQQLADFLSVDRSAMSNELCRMRNEGLLRFDKSRFTLLLPEKN